MYSENVPINSCTEKDIHEHFRLCTRCSPYFCSHCCNLDQEIINELLNEHTNNYWFCPSCRNSAFNAVFLDKDIDETCKIFFDNMKARISNFESKQFSTKKIVKFL